jgi:hypothetical protein
MSTTCRACHAPLVGIAAQPHRRRLYCSRHCYSQSRTRPLIDRFWEKIDKGGDCWLWTGSLNGNGYGQIKHGVGRPRLAHRIAWELAHGPIPPGVAVLHRCDNPACVRHGHLFLGTQLDNVADMLTKRRQAHGRSFPHAKLSDSAARSIRERYAAGGTTHRALAAEFGVDRSQVSLAIGRQSWKHVS